MMSHSLHHRRNHLHLRRVRRVRRAISVIKSFYGGGICIIKIQCVQLQILHTMFCSYGSGDPQKLGQQLLYINLQRVNCYCLKAISALEMMINFDSGLTCFLRVCSLENVTMCLVCSKDSTTVKVTNLTASFMI